MLHSQRFVCSSNDETRTSAFSTGQTVSFIVFIVFVLNSPCSLFVGGHLVLQTEGFRSARLSWRRKEGRHGSEEVCSRWGLRALGLSVCLQKVNYVLVGGSLCHRLCCLSILGKNREKMSQHHIEDIAVALLNLTVAVLCHSISSDWTLQEILNLPWYKQYYTSLFEDRT